MRKKYILYLFCDDWFFFQDRITDLQAQTQHFAEVGHFDADSLQDKSRIIAERYDKWVNILPTFCFR